VAYTVDGSKIAYFSRCKCKCKSLVKICRLVWIQNFSVCTALTYYPEIPLTLIVMVISQAHQLDTYM